jgi:hypothetical protein
MLVGRGAMSHHREPDHPESYRRQPVVVCSNKGFEEAPGASSDCTRKFDIFHAEQFSFANDWFANQNKQLVETESRRAQEQPTQVMLLV